MMVIKKKKILESLYETEDSLIFIDNNKVQVKRFNFELLNNSHLHMKKKSKTLTLKKYHSNENLIEVKEYGGIMIYPELSDFDIDNEVEFEYLLLQPEELSEIYMNNNDNMYISGKLYRRVSCIINVSTLKEMDFSSIRHTKTYMWNISFILNKANKIIYINKTHGLKKILDTTYLNAIINKIHDENGSTIYTVLGNEEIF